ncbi:MAG: type IV pilin protein [Burkholderiaceae bacterium]
MLQPGPTHRRAGGFTLIELMVVVAVLGILAAVAYPSYMNSVRKSRRADAKTALLDLAARQERWMSTNNAYTATAAQLGLAALPASVLSGSQAYYQLSVSNVTATTFTATATALGDQANDGCGDFSIDQAGVQSVTGALGAAACW